LNVRVRLPHIAYLYLMKIRPILEAPPNKTTTKILLKGVENPTTYLEIEEDINDVKELYFEIEKFIEKLKNIDNGVGISCYYSIKDGYILKVSEGCAIKWLNKIYTEGEVLGIIKDKEMI